MTIEERPPAVFRTPAGRSVTIDWDLLQPTLTRSDDFVGFGRPFNPWIVIVLVVFCKPVLGGVLLAFNAWQLGLRRQVLPLLLGGIVVAAVVMLWIRSQVSGTSMDPDRAEFFGFLLSASGALVGAAALPGHRRRFRLFQMCGGRLSSLWFAGVGMVLAAYFFNGPIYATVASIVFSVF